jgi:predicted HNH restriction endonuclease
VPASRESYRYDLVLHGKKYPPKYVICVAGRFLDGKERPHDDFNAVQAKDYFINRGYKIVGKGLKQSERLVMEDEESRFPEGKEKYRLHRSYERDTSIARKAKANRLKVDQNLTCEVCGFSFKAMYGDYGEGFIEAHHTVPVSKLKGKRKTKITEIALVCSNCHRMLHATRPWLSIEDLGKLIQLGSPTLINS